MDADTHIPADQACWRAWDLLRRPIWMFDPHSLRGVYANAAALKLWGADSLAELLARDFSRLSPAVRARTERLARATVQGDEISERWTFYPNGRPLTVQATISSYRLQDGTPVLLFEASPLDIEPEELRAVEALRHTSAMITLFDADGGPIFANPAAFTTHGAGDTPLQARFSDPAIAESVVQQALADTPVAEVCAIRTQAGERWHHVDARKVIDPVTGAAGLLVNEIDVTSRVRAEQARAAAEQKAAMAEARQRFLTEMSHELRTPLNSVIGFSELLKAADLAPQQIDHARRIHECGQHLHSVVEEMIRFSGLDDRPRDTAPPPPFEAPQVAPERPDVAGPRALRVLYVDDNAHNRALVTAILDAQGIECLTADDGSQGLDAATTGTWDLILMDIQMPVMDGVEATRAIRASATPACSVPILAVTANTLPDQLQSYFDAGMNDCIAKPIDIGALIESVAYWSEPPDAVEAAAIAG